MEMREKMERKVEENQNLDEEELRLRDETLSRTPSSEDRSKTETGINAPEGGGQGMVAAGENRGDVGEKKDEAAKRIRSGDLGGR
jgi:hypothetical protein